MGQLDGIETEVLQRREAYNLMVKTYNIYQTSFPQILIASAFQFESAPYYEVNADGLDTLSDFQAGDTEAVTKIIKRAEERAQVVTAQAAKKVMAVQTETMKNLSERPGESAQSRSGPPRNEYTDN
jgi:hypothetical protein